MRRHRILTMLLVFLVCAGARASAAIANGVPPIVLGDEQIDHDVLDTSAALIDPTGELDIDEVSHGARFGRMPAFADNDNKRVTVWLRFAISQAPHDMTSWYLVASANCITADFYAPNGASGYTHRSLGRSVPFEEHPAPSFSPALLLESRALRETPDYLRLGSCLPRGIYVHVTSGFRLSQTEGARYLPYFLQELAIAIFAVLGIVFYAITRERIYLLSAAPPLAFDLIFLGISEPRMFPSLAVPPFDATWTITHVIFFVAQWAFMRAFLELPASAKIVDRCFTGLLFALVLTYFIGDFGPYDGSEIEAFAELAFYAAPLAGAVIAIRRGSRRARFFIAGTALVALSVIDVSLMDSGITWIPQPVAHWIGLLAIPIESLLFFIGIADRLRRTILERERALAESDATKTELVASQQHHIDEIERRNVSFARFVPRAFLEQLSRDDVSQVSLGDHCERAMSVLFTDIRGFTTLSERLSPAETFSFLNSYLARTGPVIRESAGFVDKYIGDAIMALFPRDPSDAVDAALKLQREVRQFNDVRARHGGKPIAIGIGINYGDLMLGTIGETERYETTVLSDAVNIASRLEGLSKLYGAGIIAGGGLVKALPDAHHYHLRHLGTVLLKGLTQTVEAYEIFDGDASDLLLHKAATLERFEAGLAAYRRGAFDESSDIFSAIARAHREDRAAAWLRDRSAALATTLDLTWDGIDRLETK